MKACAVNDCIRKYAAKGYCHFHYNRVKRHGDPFVCLKQRNRLCAIVSCEKKHEGHGLCNTHNSRNKIHGDALKKFARSMTAKERLLSSVNTIDPNSCWEWLKRINLGGYGSIGINGKTCLAHRISYEIFKDKIPDNMLVCHSCDNRKCINPDHLFLGTYKDNCQDMIKKGRNRLPIGKDHWHFNNGIKLCKNNVIKIKEKLKNGTSALKIALEFNVTSHTIYGIKNGKTWRHVMLEEGKN